MSLTKSSAIQLGRSVANSAIFNFNVFAGSGVMSLVRGKTGTPIQEIMSVDADGMVRFANNAPVGRMGQLIGPYSLTGSNNQIVGGIPPWTKRATVLIVGAGSVAGNFGLIFYPQTPFYPQTSVKSSSVMAINGANGYGTSIVSDGYVPLSKPTNVNDINAVVHADLIASDLWSISGEYAAIDVARSGTCTGAVSCSGVLTSIGLTTFGPNFTVGKISVLCEGW